MKFAAASKSPKVFEGEAFLVKRAQGLEGARGRSGRIFFPTFILVVPRVKPIMGFPAIGPGKGVPPGLSWPLLRWSSLWRFTHAG